MTSTRLPVEDLIKEGAEAGTLMQIGAACDLVLTILPSGSVVQEVLFSESGLAATLKPGSLVVDMSSVTPIEAQTCEKKLAEKSNRLHGLSGQRR